MPAAPSAEPSFSKVDLRVRASAAEKLALGQRLTDEILYYRSVTNRRLDNSRVWRLAYEMMPPGTANRWENSSDVPSGFTRLYCDSHHSRLNQIMNAVPPFAVVARDPETLAQAPVIQECLESVLDEAGWDGVEDKIHNELAVCGNVFLKITYEQEIERHPVMTVDHDRQATRRHLLQNGDPHAALWAGVRGVKLEHQDVVAYQGVRFKVIPWEDGLIFPPSCRDPKDAYGIGECYMLRGEALAAGVKAGRYDEDAVERVLHRPEDGQPLYRRERLDEQGMSDLFGAPGKARDEERLYRDYECVELCWKMDADDDGQMEWVVVVMHVDTREILRLEYLPYEHGQPYYKFYRYLIRPEELFGMGIAELISPYHNADTAVINQIVDHGDLALNWNGNFLYDNTSDYYPDRFTLQLGRGVRVGNLGGIKQVEPMALPAEHYQLHQHFKDICDLLTATSNPSLGKATDTTKTLGEVQIVQSASHMIFEDRAAGVARQHAETWDHVRWLVSQFGIAPSGLVPYRRTAPANEVEFKTIDPQVLRARVDLLPAGLQQLSDMGSRVQQATLVRSTLISDPLVMNNVEARLLMNEEYLRALRYGQRDRLMGEIRKGIEAQRAVQKLEMMHGQGSPVLGAGQGGEGGGGGAAPGGGPPMAGVTPIEPGAPPEMAPGATMQQMTPPAGPEGP